MTTKQYVKKYRLDNKQYANHFNTDLFLDDLGQEFETRIKDQIEYRKSIGQEFEYRHFQRLILEIQQKFEAISNKKAEGGLRKGLWDAFYAKFIVTFRAKYFPTEHLEIQQYRLKIQRQKRAEEIYNGMLFNAKEKIAELKEVGGPAYKKLIEDLHRMAMVQATNEIPG